MTTKTKLIAYTVNGSGPFPIDMLRYDRVTPSTESQSALIERTFSRRGPREFEYVRVMGERCTVARWESFGWTVIPDA